MDNGRQISSISLRNEYRTNDIKNCLREGVCVTRGIKDLSRTS